jgi:type IV secretory pathway VirJ component
MAKLEREREDCHNLVSAFEQASQAIQKASQVDVYSLPILAGIKEGATVAVAGLWQAGPETIGGATTVDFEARLKGSVPLCAEPPAEKTTDGTGFVYRPPAEKPFGWWQAAWTEPPTQAAHAFAAAAGADIVTNNAEMTKTRLLAKMLDWGSEQRSQSAEAALKLGDLQVVDQPGRPGSAAVAIIFSGDGGWRDLDRSLGEILATAGVHVIGIDCLRYFWSERSPETVAADLDRLIADLVTRIGNPRIALIGYSFGADVLPAVYNRLSADARSRVKLLSLLALGKDAHFEIHVEGWVGGDPQADANPIGPELARIDPHLIQCIYGDEEADESGCLDPQLRSAQVIGTPGGHHFDEDYDSLAQRILTRIRTSS